MSSSWTFDPGGAQPALWAVGGFTFNLTSSSIVLQNAVGLVVSGLGTIVGNGFDPTPGSWSFSTQNPGAGNPAVFSFSGATGAPPGGPGVPDGGVTALLLGSVLLGFGAIRRLM